MGFLYDAWKDIANVDISVVLTFFKKLIRKGWELENRGFDGKYTHKNNFLQTHDMTARSMRSFCLKHFVRNLAQRCRFGDQCQAKLYHQKYPNPQMSNSTSNKTIVAYLNMIWYNNIHFDIFNVILMQQLYIFERN